MFLVLSEIRWEVDVLISPERDRMPLMETKPMYRSGSVVKCLFLMIVLREKKAISFIFIKKIFLGIAS